MSETSGGCLKTLVNICDEPCTEAAAKGGSVENELVIRIRSKGQHFCVQINNPYSGGYLLYDHKFKNVRIEGFNEKHLCAGDRERRQKRGVVANVNQHAKGCQPVR